MVKSKIILLPFGTICDNGNCYSGFTAFDIYSVAQCEVHATDNFLHQYENAL